MNSFAASDLLAFFQTNAGWAAGLAGSILALTALAGSLLNPARKDEIALWLMGAHTDETWSRSFTSLFDAVFGERHLSLRCFLRSTVASLVAVCVIWLLMGNLGALGLRVRAELSLGSVLAIAVAVNVLADYLSLLETRLLLGRIDRFRTVPAQAALLLLDLVLSAAIIWLAIFAYLHSPLHEGEIESFAEILGVFSIFSVLFYSTFLTSVWTWAYILSTWLVRALTRLRLAHWLDVEHQPLRILGATLAAVTLLGALSASAALRRDADGLTVADRALCTLFKGRVCLDVAQLTEVDQARLGLILLACEGGVPEECVRRGLETYEVEPERAAKLWLVACESGHPRGCHALGYLNEEGSGLELDLAEAARLYRRSCDSGYGPACVNLGLLFRHGRGVKTDAVAAGRLYSRGCKLGMIPACVNLAKLKAEGIGMDPDAGEAARLYLQGCEGGDARGCTGLGYLHERGISMDPDPGEAARLYLQGCEGGDARGCTNLGYFHEKGIGMDADLVEAARLYRQGCDGGDAEGCTGLGFLHEWGLGVNLDYSVAARLYRQGCKGGYARGCSRLGILFERGRGMDPDPTEAIRLYGQGCALGDKDACEWADFLASE